MRISRLLTLYAIDDVFYTEDPEGNIYKLNIPVSEFFLAFSKHMKGLDQ